MILRHRPLTERHWLRPDRSRKRSQFTATWSDTLTLLEREVYAIQHRGMADPVLMLDLTEADLRLDGQIRAHARPASPAVALAFESVRGPLIFRCDRYNETGLRGAAQPWQCNVRAIALTLEALRAVDRYGATQSGEQYTGYRGLPAPDPWATLARLTGRPVDDLRSLHASGRLERLVTRMTHPDTAGGSADAFNDAQAALAQLKGTS